MQPDDNSVSSGSPKFDRLNAVVAGATWLFTLIIFTLTKAPTLSFWDCGEFIATAATLGVPHPPGSPLYVLIARLFTLIPFSADIGVRVNMLSAVSSSVAALFGYLVAVRILRKCLPDSRSVLSRAIMYCGAVAGTLFLAFGLTAWNNAVEAEVYGLSMTMLLAIVWLSFIYLENRGSAFGERLMLLVFFIAFAGVAVHLTTFLVVPAVAMLFVLKKDSSPAAWFGVGVFFIMELYFIFALSSRPDEVAYYVPVLISLIFYLFYIFSFEDILKIHMFVAVGFILAAIPVFGVAINGVRHAMNPETIPIDLTALSSVGKVFFGLLLVSGVVLLVRYVSDRKNNKAQLQHLMAVLFILGTGVMSVMLHLIRGYDAFLFISAAAGLALVLALYKQINWAVLIAIVAGSMVIVAVKPFFVALTIATVVLVGGGLMKKVPGWKTAAAILLVSLLGYSIHLFIPIRSAQQPTINENNPSSSVAATVGYLERKQYGSESMTERMFTRRAEWDNQFGVYPRMGFWKFFNEQYGLKDGRFIAIFIIGIFGLWEITRRRHRYGIPLVILLLIASVGLILYMNFADGTRQDPSNGLGYLEVRDRDYFFTPAFMLFGLAIGIGISFVVQFIREMVARFHAPSRYVSVGATFVLFLLPIYAISGNYFYASRAGNYIPYDYAWNLLSSADPNGVLVTAGDNDTFPLWCLQEAYGIRKDVRVLNLSLANTHWYIKQLRSSMGLKLGWTDEQIDQLYPYRDPQGTVHRLQDQVVSNVIQNNYATTPIDFSVTVPISSREFYGRSIDSLLVLKGMAYSMERVSGGPLVSIDTSIDLLTRIFKYRSCADPRVNKDEATLRITRNYARTFLIVADTLKALGEYDRAAGLVKKAIADVPYSEDAINYLANFYYQRQQADSIKELIATTSYGDTLGFKIYLARLQRAAGNDSSAVATLKQIISEDETYKPAYDELMRVYYEQGRVSELVDLLHQWIRIKPDDQKMRALLDNIEHQIQQQSDSLKDTLHEDSGTKLE